MGAMIPASLHPCVPFRQLAHPRGIQLHDATLDQWVPEASDQMGTFDLYPVEVAVAKSDIGRGVVIHGYHCWEAQGPLSPRSSVRKPTRRRPRIRALMVVSVSCSSTVMVLRASLPQLS